jgi:uncharacterized membrane protein YciS (DUF1049 family)
MRCCNLQTRFHWKALACEKNCATMKSAGFELLYNLVTGEEKMAMITTIFAVGSAIGAVLFSLWMLKQLFASN